MKSNKIYTQRNIPQLVARTHEDIAKDIRQLRKHSHHLIGSTHRMYSSTFFSNETKIRWANEHLRLIEKEKKMIEYDFSKLTILNPALFESLARLKVLDLRENENTLLGLISKIEKIAVSYKMAEKQRADMKLRE